MSRSEVDQLIIDTLTSSELELGARIVSLEEDVAVYRELLVASLDALRKRTVEYQQLKRQHDELKCEYQAFRERVLLAAGADESGGVRV